MSYAIVAAAAFVASGLTLYSGFGLGTLLLPVFTLFFPVEIAVLATALVHGANNVFKVTLLGRNANRGVVLRFGVPAVLAAVLGALALGWLAGSGSEPAGGVDAAQAAGVTPLKLIVGVLMLVFALLEVLPRFRDLAFDRRWLPLGGVLSGFFGGLTGHQGALRSAFLAKTGLDTPAFVGSNAVIGFLVDLTRIGVYFGLFAAAGVSDFQGWSLVATGAVSAFAGVLLGRRLLHRVTMRAVRAIVGTFLFAVGGALMLGLI